MTISSEDGRHANTFDDVTGEFYDESLSVELCKEEGESLSKRATDASVMPKYWSRAEGIVEGTSNQLFNVDMLEVRRNLKPIFEADAANPFTKKNYGSLGGYLSEIKPLLAKHGFLDKCGCGKIIAYGNEGKKQFFLPVFFEVTHVDTGGRERVLMEIPLAKLDPQAIGVAMTYGRRYLIQAYFNLTAMDDDAISAIMKKSMEHDDFGTAMASIIEKMKECGTVADLQKFGVAHQAAIQYFPEDKVALLRSEYQVKLKELSEKPAPEAGEKPKAKNPKGRAKNEPEDVVECDGAKSGNEP